MQRIKKQEKHIKSVFMFLSYVLFIFSFAAVKASATDDKFASIDDILGHTQYDAKKRIKLLSKVISKEPDNAEAIAYRGWSYTDIGDYSNALDDFKLALKLKPDIPGIRYIRSEIYFELERYEDALIDLRAEMETQNIENDFTSEMRVGDIYMALGNLDLALSSYEKPRGMIETVFPIDVDRGSISLEIDLYSRMIFVLCRQSKPQKAMEYYLYLKKINVLADDVLANKCW